MTVQLLSSIQRWIGLDSDTKPTSSQIDYVGSTFYETNTGKGWIWDGTYWVEDLTFIYAMIEALKE